MANKGRLTLVEKMAIKNGIAENKTTTEIALLLDRSHASVKKYVYEELEDLLDSIVRAKMQALENLEETEETPKHKRYSRTSKNDIGSVYDREEENAEDKVRVVSDSVITKTKRELSKAGLTELNVEKVVDLSIAKAKKVGKKFPDMESLYAECIKQMKSPDFMVKKTASGGEGVTIMTSAASQRADDKKKSKSRKVNSNTTRVYNE